MYELITNVLVATIIIIMSVTIYEILKCRCKKNWLDWFILILCFIWIIFYIFVLVSEPKNSTVVGQVFVRPLNLLTFLTFNILVKIRLVGRSHGNFR